MSDEFKSGRIKVMFTCPLCGDSDQVHVYFRALQPEEYIECSACNEEMYYITNKGIFCKMKYKMKRRLYKLIPGGKYEKM